jgi:hypothetical protein
MRAVSGALGRTKPGRRRLITAMNRALYMLANWNGLP